MTDEIIKLYENAGVKKQIPKICSSNELYCKECKAHIEDAMPYCKNAEYPPFTAEKQLELIKFISGWNMFLKNNAGQFNIATGDNAISYYAENLENAICLCINSKWQFMNEEEQQQVKGILE